MSFYALVFLPFSVYKSLRNFFLSIDNEFSIFFDLLPDENSTFDESYLTWGVVITNISAISKKSFGKGISNTLDPSKAAVPFPLIGIRYVGTAAFMNLVKRGKVLISEAPNKIARSEAGKSAVKEWMNKPLASTASVVAIASGAFTYVNYCLHKDLDNNKHKLNVDHENLKHEFDINLENHKLKCQKDFIDYQFERSFLGIVTKPFRKQTQPNLPPASLDKGSTACALEETFSSKIFDFFIYL